MKQVMPDTPPDYDSTRVIERPDGFYWKAKGHSREYGPFPTLLAAVQDMERDDEEALEPGETLAEAEAEIGISDWIDPDTGDPAELDGRFRDDH